MTQITALNVMKKVFTQTISVLAAMNHFKDAKGVTLLLICVQNVMMDSHLMEMVSAAMELTLFVQIARVILILATLVQIQPFTNIKMNLKLAVILT